LLHWPTRNLTAGQHPAMNRARWHRDIDTLGHLDHGATIRAIAAVGTWSFGAIVGGFSESTVVAARRETLRAGCGLSAMLAELGGVFRGVGNA
jgi:hypothetical protein